MENLPVELHPQRESFTSKFESVTLRITGLTNGVRVSGTPIITTGTVLNAVEKETLCQDPDATTHPASSCPSAEIKNTAAQNNTYITRRPRPLNVQQKLPTDDHSGRHARTPGTGLGIPEILEWTRLRAATPRTTVKEPCVDAYTSCIGLDRQNIEILK